MPEALMVEITHLRNPRRRQPLDLLRGRRIKPASGVVLNGGDCMRNVRAIYRDRTGRPLPGLWHWLRMASMVGVQFTIRVAASFLVFAFAV